MSGCSPGPGKAPAMPDFRLVQRHEESSSGDLFDTGTGLQVGQVHRISNESEPEEWKAWLWPSVGTYPTDHGGVGLMPDCLAWATGPTATTAPGCKRRRTRKSTRHG